MPIAWHAPYELLKPQTRDMSRAIHSLMEELEAMDWYGQRVDVTDDQELARILSHHAEEEKEHAAMLLEWIRRHDPEWDRHLRTYLFKSGDVTEIEHGEAPASREGDSPPSEPPSEPPAEPEGAVDQPERSLTVGSLRPPRP